MRSCFSNEENEENEEKDWLFELSNALRRDRTRGELGANRTM